jgi:RNA polymerase sigma-70 factor (ECF subfamily)
VTWRDVTVSDVEQLAGSRADADVAFHMDEDTFRAFYDRTSRMIWAYLARVTGDRQLADDLLQETYYRFLRTTVAWESETHRRNYLFRIATNLARDGRRRRLAKPEHVTYDDELAGGASGPATASGEDAVLRAERSATLSRAMAHLTPREREMLWLAYARDSSHREIADVLGLRVASIKQLLFRARRKLAELLRAPNAATARRRS